MAQKVRLLAVMGGMYPEGKECNLMGGGDQGFGLHNHHVASAASSYVAAHWPVQPVHGREGAGGATIQNLCDGSFLTY